MNLHIDVNFLDYVVYPIVVGLIALGARFVWRLAAKEKHLELAEAERDEAPRELDADALASLAVALGESNKRIDDLEERLISALGRIESLERNESQLIGWILTLHRGINDGTIPPMPDIPTNIRALLGI